MATWRKHTVSIDLETAEIISPYERETNYYVVSKEKTTYQPDRTKSFIIIKYTYLCRKKPKNLELWENH